MGPSPERLIGPRQERKDDLTSAAGWRVTIRSSALKSLKRMPAKHSARIVVAIEGLPVGDVRRLTDKPNEWRLRVGEWRVVFTADFRNRLIDVLWIGPRGAAYKGR